MRLGPCRAFSPDGKRIATTSSDGTAKIYAMNVEDLVKLARTRVTRELTVEERRKYLHETMKQNRLLGFKR